MFDRYTAETRQAIFFARYEASLVGATALEVEHLWLGMLQQNKRLLKRLAPHINVEAVRERLAQRCEPMPRTSMTAEIALSPAAEHALLQAAGPDTGSQSPIKVDDIVRALLLEEASPAAGGRLA